MHNQKFAESLVSPPPLGGAGAQWAPALDRAGRRECHAFGMTERARCQRPLRMGCVEALASCPLSRLAATALPKGEPSLASPFGGRWCPVGTVQRLVSAAASVGDGRSPLGCITRAGRRECPRRGRRGQGASLTAQPRGNHLLAAPPPGKGGAKPLFPSFLSG